MVWLNIRTSAIWLTRHRTSSNNFGAPHNRDETPEIGTDTSRIFLQGTGVGLQTFKRKKNGQMKAALDGGCKLMGGEATSPTNP